MIKKKIWTYRDLLKYYNFDYQEKIRKQMYKKWNLPRYHTREEGKKIHAEYKKLRNAFLNKKFIEFEEDK